MTQAGPVDNVGEMAAGQRTALVIMNPAADGCSPAEIRRMVSGRLSADEWRAEFREVDSLEELDRAADEAGEGGCDLVVVAGGDGTVARVAGRLVGKTTRMAVLPVGKDNTIATELGIPADVDRAASLLSEGHDIAGLDCLQVGNRYYFLQVGTAVVPETDSRAMAGVEAGDAPPGVAADLRKSVKFESRRFTILVDGHHYRVSAWQVIAVNAGVAQSGLLEAGPSANVSDGAAVLVVLRVRGFRQMFLAGLSSLVGGAEHGISIDYHLIRHDATIVPDRPMPVQGDGEAIGATPLHVTLLPRAVSVVVPPGRAPAPEPEWPVRHRRRLRYGSGWFRTLLLGQLSPFGAIDTALFLSVHRLPHPRILNLAARGIEVGMAGGRGWLAGLAGARLSAPHRMVEDLLRVAPPLWLTTITIEFPIKVVFVRPRPFAALMLATVAGRKPSSYSFPSGHSASAFAGAWLLSHRYPRLSPAFYAFAGLVAFSRVYAGVHYPSDVLIGAGTGMGLAALYRWTIAGIGRLLGRRD